MIAVLPNNEMKRTKPGLNGASPLISVFGPRRGMTRTGRATDVSPRWPAEVSYGSWLVDVLEPGYDSGSGSAAASCASA